MNKFLNTKSIAVATASLIAIGIIGAFAYDNHKTQAARKSLETNCPEWRELKVIANSNYKKAIQLGRNTDKNIDILNEVRKEVRACDEFGY